MLLVRVCLDLSVGPQCVKVCCVADEVPVNVLLLDKRGFHCCNVVGVLIGAKYEILVMVVGHWVPGMVVRCGVPGMVVRCGVPGMVISNGYQGWRSDVRYQTW